MLDSFINKVDMALQTLFPPRPRLAQRVSPAKRLPEATLSDQEKTTVAGFMRVNHAGEVCAQALYQGQALTARLTHIKKQMNQAAIEEVDHLAWCEERLHELESKTSLLNPVWYVGSFIIGALAGLVGDKVSLGFVAETEQQVTAHLQKHLDNIPQHDHKTRSILELMKEDETHHAAIAIEAGAIELPTPVKQMMSIVSKWMTKSSYYI